MTDDIITLKVSMYGGRFYIHCHAFQHYLQVKNKLHHDWVDFKQVVYVPPHSMEIDAVQWLLLQEDE